MLRAVRHGRRLLFLNVAVAILLAFSLFQPAGAVPEGDLITDFNSFIYLSHDSSLRISETIDIYFGKKERENIVRFIPLTAEIAQQRHNIYIKLNSVTCAGKPIPYRESFQDNKLKVEFGDDAKEVGGQHEFVISYIAHGAVRPSDLGPQIYWNVTGAEWPMPIERASVVFCPPSGVAPHALTGQSSTGPDESMQSRVATYSDKAIEFKASDLTAGRALVIILQVPKDAVALPSATAEWGWTVEQTYLVALSILAATWGWLLLGVLVIAAVIVRYWINRAPPQILKAKSSVTSYRTQ